LTHSVFAKFRTEEGFASNSSGRYLDLNKLSKLDKLKFRMLFIPFRQFSKLDFNSLTLLRWDF
jgi:CBS domain-containing protein